MSGEKDGTTDDGDAGSVTGEGSVVVMKEKEG